MSFVITISTKLKNKKTLIVENEFTFVVKIIELFNIKIIINNFANITKSTIVKFLNILIQFFKFEIVR